MIKTSVTLSRPLRAQLESTVKTARDVAEKGARAALNQLAVAEAKAPDYLTDELKALRRRLRAHGRALGDAKAENDTQEVKHLVWEVAYEHWHRMLFARFLAENGLLMWEPGAPVSLDDCRDMVDNHPDIALGAKGHWELAGKLAARMLPQVFKPQSPVFELTFAPEHQRELERLLGALPIEVFRASDSLGWVYQFWQAKRKDEVNVSGERIGADELPAVTQLFTEPYMVDFLLHNSLGAWWVTRYPAKTCPTPLTYLRKLSDGTPAAGKFEGWPDSLADFKLLDPCCGSGHFLVAAFLMLVPMRMAAEGLSAKAAVNAVLDENLHGLELDARCVEIAVFALALAAWRFPDGNGDPLGVWMDMPLPHIACCGLKVAAHTAEWEALVLDSQHNASLLRQELRLLHTNFAQAPVLGSLLNPSSKVESDLVSSNFDTLKVLIETALSKEGPGTLCDNVQEINDDTFDLALTARGLLDAARLLDTRYNLVITNVPYLARGKQCDVLKSYCEQYYPEAKKDLANVFLERCLELSVDGTAGVVQIVMPQNWLFLTSYEEQRKKRLKESTWNFVALLGNKGFQTPMWDFNVQLLTLTNAPARTDLRIWGIDVSGLNSPYEKASGLIEGALQSVIQSEQIANPDTRISLNYLSYTLANLEQYATINPGISPGDTAYVRFNFWELPKIAPSYNWVLLQSTPTDDGLFSGCHYICRSWDSPNVSGLSGFRLRGKKAWGRPGVLVAKMAGLRCSLYAGQAFDANSAVISPYDGALTSSILAFCSTPEYREYLRALDRKTDVSIAAMLKVPFDKENWEKEAMFRYPGGIKSPSSNDLTQWIFHGHPRESTDVLQVAVARLTGYAWPAEFDGRLQLSDEAQQWMSQSEALDVHVDDDGIVCLPSVRGEKPAHERLLSLLIDTWEKNATGSWKSSILDKLLAQAEYEGKELKGWLRDKFFEQHCKTFHHRPFIWHVWDGLRDGFGALVNYHKLDARNVERLIHTYLGDWIRQQEAGVRDGVDGAQTRLAAAQDLKRRLELILEGEKPYDIFVRWKPLAEQPIGWNPDLNDGVRLNIRPFMTAEALRHNKKPKLNITWDKDRGKDVETAPWFKVFNGERINDHHLTLAEKKEQGRSYNKITNESIEKQCDATS